jgi:Fic family protein
MADDMAVAINTKTLVIDSEILDLVAELDEFKGAWRALSTLAPDRLSALRRVATIESIGSSTRIEGNKLSDRDVEKLLSVIEIQTLVVTRNVDDFGPFGAPLINPFT